MILKIFTLWLFGILAIAYLAIFAFGEGPALSFIQNLKNWDGGHYLSIASAGYSSVENTAFFPLFPFLVKALSPVFLGNLFLTGLVLNIFSFLAFLFVFFTFVKNKYSKNIAFSSLISFLLFPTAFYCVSFYPESVFLLTTAPVFYFMLQKKYFPAAIFIILSSLAKFLGSALFISFAYSYLAEIQFSLRKISLKIIIVLFSLSGIVSYCLFQWYLFGDPLKFFSSQTLWGRQITDPVSTLLSYIWPIITLQPRPPMDYFDFSLTLFFLGILALGTKKIPSSLWIFSAFVILVPISTGTLSSMPRYLLGSLGVFVIIGKILEEKKYLKIPLWTLLLTLQVIFLALFVNGFWVA